MPEPKASPNLVQLEAEDSMKSVKFGTVGVLAGCVALTAAGSAFAQEAQVGAGATATTTTTTTVAPAPAPAAAPPAPATGMALPGATPPPPPPGTRDHDLMVGHFAVGYMGFRAMPLADAAGGIGTIENVPVIGVRYWLDPMLGIDAGLGMLFSGGSSKTGDTSVDRQGFTAIVLHGGVPLALAGSQHFSFQIVPEMNLGFSSSGIAGNPDTDLSGLHLDIGARAGAEIHFGFIGIPELALQGGVGLALRWDHTKATVKSNPEVDHSSSYTTFGTNTGDNPWNIFAGNVAALYYFD